MKKGLTLTEAVVAIAVFALIMISAAGIFVSIRQSWQSQSEDIDLVQNCRWAMEFMSKELRQARGSTIVILSGGDYIAFKSTNNDNISFFKANPDKLFRQFNSGTAQELANLISNNKGSIPVFNLSSGIVTITLTTGKNGKSYSMRTQVWPRN